MDIRTYRAKSVPEALELVRRELGSDATVMHTREINAGLWGRMLGNRGYEVAAAASAGAALESGAGRPTELGPSRGAVSSTTPGELPSEPQVLAAYSAAGWEGTSSDSAGLKSNSQRWRESPSSAASGAEAAAPLAARLATFREMQGLPARFREGGAFEESGGDDPLLAMPPGLFDAFVELVDADADEASARDLVERLQREEDVDFGDADDVRERLRQVLASELRTAGPLQIRQGEGRRVALVGPTGVGKTTTIAKLAANYRLCEHRRVGLITVDTYRIAAVEQLRTYADIIDLPMEVVSTPREMRRAIERMHDFDLVLMDTAGRSPRDEVKIRELRAILQAAEPSEVHLVLSVASSGRSLAAAIDRFSPVGVTALVLTKLDEAPALGHLLLLRGRADLPVSYLTDGQNVPDDIYVAEARHLAEAILEAPGKVTSDLSSFQPSSGAVDEATQNS